MTPTERREDERGYDVEVVALVDAMNLVPGIRTIESCCGHGRDEFRIWFQAEALAALPPLLYWFDGCHCGFYGWRVTVGTDCGCSPVTFRVVGPVGEQAYREADRIAELIRADIRESDGSWVESRASQTFAGALEETMTRLGRTWDELDPSEVAERAVALLEAEWAS